MSSPPPLGRTFPSLHGAAAPTALSARASRTWLPSSDRRDMLWSSSHTALPMRSSSTEELHRLTHDESTVRTRLQDIQGALHRVRSSESDRRRREEETEQRWVAIEEEIRHRADELEVRVGDISRKVATTAVHIEALVDRMQAYSQQSESWQVTALTQTEDLRSAFSDQISRVRESVHSAGTRAEKELLQQLLQSEEAHSKGLASIRSEVFDQESRLLTRVTESIEDQRQGLRQALQDGLDELRIEIQSTEQRLSERLILVADEVKQGRSALRDESELRLADRLRLVTEDSKQSEQRLADRLNLVADEAKKTEQRLVERLVLVADEAKQSEQRLSAGLASVAEEAKQSEKRLATQFGSETELATQSEHRLATRIGTVTEEVKQEFGARLGDLSHDVDARLEEYRARLDDLTHHMDARLEEMSHQREEGELRVEARSTEFLNALRRQVIEQTETSVAAEAQQRQIRQQREQNDAQNLSEATGRLAADVAGLHEAHSFLKARIDELRNEQQGNIAAERRNSQALIAESKRNQEEQIREAQRTAERDRAREEALTLRRIEEVQRALQHDHIVAIEVLGEKLERRMNRLQSELDRTFSIASVVKKRTEAIEESLRSKGDADFKTSILVSEQEQPRVLRLDGRISDSAGQQGEPKVLRLEGHLSESSIQQAAVASTPTAMTSTSPAEATWGSVPAGTSSTTPSAGPIFSSPPNLCARGLSVFPAVDGMSTAAASLASACGGGGGLADVNSIGVGSLSRTEHLSPSSGFGLKTKQHACGGRGGDNAGGSGGGYWARNVSGGDLGFHSEFASVGGAQTEPAAARREQQKEHVATVVPPPSVAIGSGGSCGDAGGGAGDSSCLANGPHSRSDHRSSSTGSGLKKDAYVCERTGGGGGGGCGGAFCNVIAGGNNFRSEFSPSGGLRTELAAARREQQKVHALAMQAYQVPHDHRRLDDAEVETKIERCMQSLHADMRQRSRNSMPEHYEFSPKDSCVAPEGQKANHGTVKKL